jgi:putative endonuclease
MKRATRDMADGGREWFVYILECADKTLYTGATSDVRKRLARHQTGKGARYTRGRLPVKLKYAESCGDKSGALQREYAIKRLTRKEKLRLCKGVRHARHVGQAL